jgi:hypothetical protein
MMVKVNIQKAGRIEFRTAPVANRGSLRLVVHADLGEHMAC